MFSACEMAICELTLSVIIISTQLLPVNGKLQLSILLFPFYKNITTNQNKRDMTWVRNGRTVESSDLVLVLHGDDDLGFVAGHQVPAHPLHQATLKQEPQLTT